MADATVSTRPRTVGRVVLAASVAYMGVLYGLSDIPGSDVQLPAPAPFMHFVAYFGLATLLYVGLRWSFDLGRLRASVFAFTLTVAYGVIDEWHQSFVPGRHPTFADVFVDALGAALALSLLWLTASLRDRAAQWMWVHPRIDRAVLARRGVVAGLALVLIAGLLHWAGAFERLELRLVDMWFRTRFVWVDVSPKESPVVVVGIDERSLTVVGRWPWHRSDQARLIEAISAAEPLAIGVDILYGEAGDGGDPTLANTLRRVGNVVLAASTGGVDAVFPVPRLANAAAAIGRIDVVPDVDGIVRRVQPQGHLPLFAQQVAQVAGMELDLPVGPTEGSIWINYRPQSDSPQITLASLAPIVSAVDVMSGQHAAALRGRAVLVGKIAHGLRDLHHTPFLSAVPGVHVHAVLLRSFLLGDYVRSVSWGPTWVGVLLFGLAAGWMNIALRPWAAALLSLGAFVGLMVGGLGVFLAARAFIELVPYLFVLVGAFVAGLWHAYGVVDRDARRVRSLFRRYVAPEVADRLMQDPRSVELGRRARITVLFADVRGFTQYAEAASPEAAVATLDQYLWALSEPILAEGGTLDKYIGDAVMAVFGAPLEIEDHAAAAVRAAVEMRRRVTALSASTGVGRLEVGIGIHTGEAVVGSVGPPQRREYTAIGDAVNVASRLEDVAGPGEILLSADTVAHLDPRPGLSVPWEVTLRGRSETIRVFRLERMMGVTAEPGSARLNLREGDSR